MVHAVYQPNPSRILFGAGCIEGLAGEAAKRAITRCVVICSPTRTGLAESLANQLAPASGLVCPAARPNFPESAYDDAVEAIKSFGADGLIVVGGGTAIGLGKSVVATLRIPMIAVPTTYSGSELASNWYVGSGDGVRRGRDLHALPVSIFYDPKLTCELPPRPSAASGMNAMAHAVESLYGPDVSPVVSTMAEEAIRLLGASLPACVDRPDDLDARTSALQGAWFAAGFRARAGLEHIMAQTLRDAFDLDHAMTHAVSLPYVVAFNASAAPGPMAAIARALDVGGAAAGLYALNRRLGLPTGLGDLGMPRGGIERAVEILDAAAIVNPRPASADQLRKIIEVAWVGDPPV